MATEAKIKITAKDKTRHAFSSVNKSMKGMSSGVLGMHKQILGLVGVGGIGALIKGSIDAADSLAKTADKLGVTTDALQEYRFAAERVNVKQTALDMGLQRFSRRLGEADKGSGELVKTLEDLNISTRDSAGNIRSVEDVLKEYANGIQAAESNQEKLRLAFKAFDSEGAAMVNMLRDGAAGLEEFREKARDAGAVMDEELIRKAEIINDRWESMAETIGVKFKSAVSWMVDGFVDTRAEAEKMTHQITVLEKEIGKIEEAGRASPFQRMFGESNVEKVKKLKDEIDGLRVSLKAIEETDGGDGGDSGKQEKLDEETQLMLFADAMRIQNKQLYNEQVQEKLDEETQLMLFAEAMRLQNQQLYNEQSIAADEQMSQAKQDILGQTFANLAVLMSSGSKKVFRIGQLAAISSATISGLAASVDAFKAGMSIGGPAAPGFAAAYKASSLIATGVQIAAIASTKPPGGARALGGPVANGSSYLVGERGPEIFTPNNGGNIAPNNQMGGAPNITMNAIIQSWSPEDVTQNEDALFNGIRNRLVDWMNEEGFSFS